MKQRHFIVVALATFLSVFVATDASRAELPRLHAEGARVADAAGNDVVLRGVNLGNWLILETWMSAWPQHDQAEVFATLDRRFGEAERERLMEIWRDGYVRPRDFAIIKSFGFNVVRVPFDYQLLQALDDDEAFAWLDRAIEMAEAAEIYVILDLHGAPGGQSDQHHTGEAGRDRLWDDRAAQDQTVTIWRRIAQRYKHRNSIAAYDLLNEPWSDYQRDVRPELKEIMLRCLAAIREEGDDHIALLPGSLQDGPFFYGDLRAELGDEAMHNVGFTHHYYPGLFGSPQNLLSHARTLGVTFPAVQAYLEAQGGPFLVGEFNVVFDSTGGERMMRRYFDDFADRGWMATAWSYKLLKPEGGVAGDNWYFVTNADSLPKLDLERDSLETIEAWFERLATMPLAIDTSLQATLTAERAPEIALPPLPALPTEVPVDPAPADWALLSVGGAPVGATQEDDLLAVVAGGSDIFERTDSFGFVARPLTDGQSITAMLQDLLDSDRYAKAGLMFRGGADPQSPGAPFVMINAFPDGTVSFTCRKSQGTRATEEKFAPGPAPVAFRLTREGDSIAAFIGQGDVWYKAGQATIADASEGVAGLAVCAHADGSLTRATFNQVSIGVEATALAQRLIPLMPSGENLLNNASFETVGEEPDMAANWNRWGQWLNRHDDWTPTLDGKSMIGYHHWRRDSADDSGMWQDVEVEPGKTYTFGIFAHADKPQNGENPALRVTLALEAVDGDQPVLLTSRDIDVVALEPAGGWSLVTVKATVPTDSLRVLIRIAPSADAPRGGAVKFDNAFLIADDQ